ncbi:hypothetical protein GCM10011591_35840 [Nocardia camponoti]|uniref:Uncharacterized protein n=1 Tax=Nocardia camponoti TaxID=1616106 RepID=A0A917VBQ9_9NOCA|nr:hypothetical protein GCM10011591_35840 [Nocardia camponoti]
MSNLTAGSAWRCGFGNLPVTAAFRIASAQVIDCEVDRIRAGQSVRTRAPTVGRLIARSKRPANVASDHARPYAVRTNLMSVLIHLRELPGPFWLDFLDLF